MATLQQATPSYNDADYEQRQQEEPMREAIKETAQETEKFAQYCRATLQRGWITSLDREYVAQEFYRMMENVKEILG
jgi:hypothetical protein